MGKAHSQAYRNVNRYFPDAPEVEMKVIVGRKPDETEEARKTLGWQEASTDWKAVMRRDDIDVVIITGFASVESAVECMKHGTLDYIEKPFTEDELRLFVKRALIKRRDRIEKQIEENDLSVSEIGKLRAELAGLSSSLSVTGAGQAYDARSASSAG